MFDKQGNGLVRYCKINNGGCAGEGCGLNVSISSTLLDVLVAGVGVVHSTLSALTEKQAIDEIRPHCYGNSA